MIVFENNWILIAEFNDHVNVIHGLSWAMNSSGIFFVMELC